MSFLNKECLEMRRRQRMKAITVFVAVLCLIAALPVFGEEDPVFGRKLIPITVEEVEALRPDSEQPPYGTKPDEEWSDYNDFASTLWQDRPAWSPDGTLIAFTAGSNICVIPVEGGESVKLWDGFIYYEYEGKQYYINESSFTRALCFSPDGSEILFDASIIDEERGTKVTLHFREDGTCSGVGVQNSIPVIRAVNIATGEARIVVDNGMEPQFSRKGRYFSYKKIGTSGITVREVSSGNEWVLDGLPMWSRCFSGDSNYIIYDNNDQFYRIPVTGGEPEQISFDESSTFITRRYFPDCSPNGDYVLFDGNAGSRSGTYYDENGEEIGGFSTSSMEKISVLSVDSGLSYPLIPMEDNVQSTTARFSPDGTRICYARKNRDISGGRNEIYIMDFNPESYMKPTYAEANIPYSFALLGNYPNPFNPSTTIEFSLSEAGFIDLIVYNVMGQKVRELVSYSMPAGIHSVEWNGRDDTASPVSAGVYLTRLRMGHTVKTGRMTLLK